MNIKNHVHKFNIEGKEIELTINCKNGYWTSDITKGETGTGNCSGGQYKTLQLYLKEQERTHIYSYSFFNHGYKHAKNYT